MELLIQAVLTGILLGGLYAVVALGLNLIYGVLDIINFAHGTIIMVAMYATYWLWRATSLDPYILLLIVTPAMFVFGWGLYRLLIDPLIDRSPSSLFLTTLGLMVILESAARLLWTSNLRTIRTPYATESITVFGASVSISRLMAVGGSLAVGAILWWILQRTDLGRAIRATASDRIGAQVCGIDVRRIFGITFAMGVAVAAAAGAMLASFNWISPAAGDTYNLPAFLVVIIGGLGSMPGAIVGGLIVGLADAVGAAYLPGTTKQVLLLVVFVTVLLVKPTGIFGKKVRA